MPTCTPLDAWFALAAAVHVLVATCRLVPGELRCLRESEGAELLPAAVGLDHRVGHRIDVGGVEENGRIADDLGDRARVRRGNGTAARHRLERPAAQSPRRGSERRGTRRGGRARRDAPARPSRGSRRLGERLEPVEAATGEDEAELWSGLAKPSERLEQAWVILVRPRPCGVEDHRLGLLVAAPEHGVVDRVRHDVDACWIEVEELDCALPHELAGDEHRGGRARCAVVRDAPERAACRAEELRHVAMLRVMKRDDGRALRPRRGHGERVVQDVELGYL